MDTTYDRAGNVVLDVDQRAYTWDPLAMMTSATVDGRTFRYLYDANNERIAAVERVPVGTELRNRTTFTLRGAGNQLLSTWTDDWTSGSRVFTRKEDTIWRGSQVLASAYGSNTMNYTPDHLGSPRLITNGSGSVLDQQNFEPFGGGGLFGSGALQFTGHERDQANIGGGSINLPDYFHARFYDKAGRFLSVDPVLNLKLALRNPQNWNRYAYVMNNPLRYTDPTGKDVSIRLNFTGKGWTDEEKERIIALVMSWYQNQKVGKVYVFDGATASHGGNFFTRMFGGYTSIAVSSASGGKHTYSTVWAGNYSKLSLQQRLNAISNTIIHETVAHHFKATLLHREDFVKYNRELGWGYYDAIRSRYGTVADSYAFADPATRSSMTNGPIGIHPEDLKDLQRNLGPKDVEPPDYDN